MNLCAHIIFNTDSFNLSILLSYDNLGHPIIPMWNDSIVGDDMSQAYEPSVTLMNRSQPSNSTRLMRKIVKDIKTY
jgi:hypothetical protein